MAGAGYRDWAAGNVPTAAQFDTFLQEQTVMVFATAAARDTALSTAKSEGMVAYLLDSNTFTVYSGAVWSTIGPVHGALTSWTPTVTQSGSVTVTNTYSRYRRDGRNIDGWFSLSVTGSGTGANGVIVSTPVTAAQSDIPVGTAQLFDISVNGHFNVCLHLESTSSFSLRSATGVGDTRLGVAGFTSGLASGDLVKGQFHFEAAADA